MSVPGSMFDDNVVCADVETSDPCGDLFAALSKAQGELKNASKDSENPHFKSQYADLAASFEACRAPLAKHGLSIVQIPHNQGDDIAVTTILGHSSGQWIRGRLSMKPMKFDAQGAGSVIKYLRRYSLQAIVGIADGGDDDGEAAVGRPDSKPAKTVAPKTPSADPYRHIAEDIKNAIDGAKTEAALTTIMVASGHDGGNIIKSSPLDIINSHSASACEFLVKRATDRRALLAQRP